MTGRSSASLMQWAKVFGDSAYDSRDNFSAGYGRRACNKAQLHWKI
ncbi:MAG: hypothetical protein QW508_02635 [Conexivisphaerales archaeon]